MMKLSEDDRQLIKDDLDSLLIDVSEDQMNTVLDCYTELRKARLIQDGMFDDGDFRFTVNDGLGIETEISKGFREDLRLHLTDNDLSFSG